MNIGSMLNHYANGTKFQQSPPAPKREKKKKVVSTKEVEVSDDISHSGLNADRRAAVIARWKTLLEGNAFSSEQIRIIFGMSVNGSWSVIRKMRDNGHIKEVRENTADGVGGRSMKVWTWA